MNKYEFLIKLYDQSSGITWKHFFVGIVMASVLYHLNNPYHWFVSVILFLCLVFSTASDRRKQIDRYVEKELRMEKEDD